jgi:hypothetical protein
VGSEGAGEADERPESRARCPGQPGVEVRRRQARVVEVVEQAELFAQQERAVELAVGLLDLPERGELADGLAFGGLQERPAGALDPAAGWGVGALVGVPFVAADLVGRAAREAADVERVKVLMA